MKRNLDFTKYKVKGSDYHHQEINKKILNLFKFNAFVWARYQNQVNLIAQNTKRYFKKTKRLKILDLGCGDAVLLYLLKKRLSQYSLDLYGMDLSAQALVIAKRKIPEAKFVKADVTQLKFPSGSFNIIISSDVIEHLQSPEKMIKQIKRVLKKNGVTIIGTPIRFTEKPQDRFHFQEFFPDEFKNHAKKYFSSVTLTQSHPLIYLLIYQLPLKILGKKIYLFKIFINLLAIFFNLNPFSKVRSKTREKTCYSYMFLVCRN